MKLKEKMYFVFAKLAPLKYRKFIEEQLTYAGYKIGINIFIGSVNLLAVLAFIGIAIFPWSFYNRFDFRFLFYGILAVFLVELVAYLIVYFAMEERRKRIEEALPDLLYLVAANLKAGMPPYEALKSSALKDFGPIKEEIDRATAKAYGTSSFTDALLDINNRIESETLERALKLLTTAIKSGGHMAQLLEELADDLAATKGLKKELETNTKTYTIFILFIVIFGAPLLMAISIRFVDTVAAIQSKLTNSGSSYGLGLFFGEIAITASFLVKVAWAMFIITGLSASMLLGAIKEGKMKYGLKYAPFVVLSTVIVFYAVRFVVSGYL